MYRPATDIFFAVKTRDEARTLAVVWGIQAVVGSYADALACATKCLNLEKGTKFISVSSNKLELKEI